MNFPNKLTLLNSEMELRSLPSYTTERYYILSEIEENATFYPSEIDEGIFQN